MISSTIKPHSAFRTHSRAAAGILLSTGVLLFCVPEASAQSAAPAPSPYPVPQQDQGLPYTRSARAKALELIRGYSGLFEGSRYGIVQGCRVRVGEENPIEAATLKVGDKSYVPSGFATLLLAPAVQIPEIPADLKPIAPRWVYSPHELATAQPVPKDTASIEVKGAAYYDIDALAGSRGLKVSRHPRGLVLIGKEPFDFLKLTATDLDTVITLFDMPEKLADPAIATRNIPSLAAQGAWETHAKASPEALKAYEGPETEWTPVPSSTYSLEGFNAALLGSEVPAPGIYPRLLFSEKDIPMLRERLEKSVVGRMSLIEIEELLRRSWWNPATSDGQVFDKLASGNFTESDFLDKDGKSSDGLPGGMTGQKNGYYASHVNYLTNGLTTMAMFCLLTGDDEHGKKAADAIANFMRVCSEARVDAFLEKSDSEFGSIPGSGAAETGWRGICGLISHCDLAFMLDFGGKWMSPEQKHGMQRLIAKAIYGRRDTHQSGPVSWIENNHATWHTTNFLAAMAIEGLPGCDPELFPAAVRTIRAFLDYGIDEKGQIFESNGKSGGGINFQVLNMIALARRGQNLWGHPHWRQLLQTQVENTAPDGTFTVSGGTFSDARFSTQTILNIKAFYPGNLNADYLMTLNFPDLDLAKVDLEQYRQDVRAGKDRRLRLPGLTYSGFTRGVLYDCDWKQLTREELDLPLTFLTPVHGILSAFSDASPTATWLNLSVRPNQYYGAGHHHNDAGIIHFSSGGVDWIQESPFSMSYAGRFHNQVCVDGTASAEGQWAAPGSYLGAQVENNSAVAACDLAYNYSWVWKSQLPNGKWDMSEPDINRPWELDTHPNAVKYFKGTQHWKQRPWWPSYNFSNWYPVLRAPWNPMQFCFRTAGLVRGAHPYGFVVDDLQKDGKPHLYQWRGMLKGDVVKAELPGIPKGTLALAVMKSGTNAKIDLTAPRSPVTPGTGDPVLLVVPLGMTESNTPGEPLIDASVFTDGTKDRQGKFGSYNCLSINRTGVDARFRVLLIPATAGEPLPVITPMKDGKSFKIAWKDQSDVIAFAEKPDSRTRVTVSRDGKDLVSALK